MQLYLEFDSLGKNTRKNLEFLTVLTCSEENFNLTQIIYHINKIIFS